MLQVAFGSISLTTFNSSSLTLTIQLSLAPHPGATPEITQDPSRGMAYPVRWLHCQSAQYPTVTSDAPLLDYRGLNPGFCHPISRGRTITYTAFAVSCLTALIEMLSSCAPTAMVVIPQWDRVAQRLQLALTRLESHAWEAAVLPLNYTRTHAMVANATARIVALPLALWQFARAGCGGAACYNFALLSSRPTP